LPKRNHAVVRIFAVLAANGRFKKYFNTSVSDDPVTGASDALEKLYIK
jgi:hypothetical protein